eukprot:scaffold102507_cov65-Phaeocystis_antarctica.AAC.1
MKTSEGCAQGHGGGANARNHNVPLKRPRARKRECGALGRVNFVRLRRGVQGEEGEDSRLRSKANPNPRPNPDPSPDPNLFCPNPDPNPNQTSARS